MMGPPPIERLAREPEPGADGPPIVLRIGSLVAGGVLAALAASLPASLRTGDPPSIAGALLRWLVLSAVATPLAIAAVAVIERARVGWRLLVGERGRLVALGVLWWSVLETTLCAAVGAVLRKTTHQHSLAGVTFAVIAVVSGLLLALFARRIAAMLEAGGDGLQRLAIGVGAACVLVTLALAGARLSRAEGMHAAAGLVDTISFTVASVLGSARVLARSRSLALAGVPVAVLVLMLGLASLRGEPGLREALAETAPMHALVIALFNR
jgi:hypothetical protein